MHAWTEDEFKIASCEWKDLQIALKKSSVNCGRFWSQWKFVSKEWVNVTFIDNSIIQRYYVHISYHIVLCVLHVIKLFINVTMTKFLFNEILGEWIIDCSIGQIIL